MFVLVVVVVLSKLMTSVWTPVAALTVTAKVAVAAAPILPLTSILVREGVVSLKVRETFPTSPNFTVAVLLPVSTVMFLPVALVPWALLNPTVWPVSTLVKSFEVGSRVRLLIDKGRTLQLFYAEPSRVGDRAC